MACSSPSTNYILVAVIILVIMDQGEAEIGEGECMAVKQLPVPDEQLKELANDVCVDLFESKKYDQKTNITNCTENFSSPNRELSACPSKLRIKCRTEGRVNFEIKPSEERQLVILIPHKKSGIIYYRLLTSGTESGLLSTRPHTNYTLWSTILNNDGVPSTWLRGPDVPEVQKVDINIEEPKYDYVIKNSYKIDVTFKWNFITAVDSCADDVRVTNTCNKEVQGIFYRKTVKAGMPRTVTISGLPLYDNCTFTVFKNGGVHRKDYSTPLCENLEGCVPPPSIPKDIFIEASEDSGSTWVVFVSWAPPKFPPDIYNVTLRADGVHNLVLLGNATEVTFDNVTGEGMYNVSVDAISTRGKELTTTRALFPPRMESSSMAVVMVGAWCAVLLTCVALVGLTVWHKRRRVNNLRHLYFQGLEDNPQKECSPEIAQESGVKDSWEIRPERLLLHEVIGEGAFGVVRRGTLTPNDREVAVKMLKDFPTHEDNRSFRVEMELMKSVGAHPHVVSLVGCCSGRRPLIVAEYCSRGDLLSFLRCSWDIMVSKRNAKYYNNNLENDYRNDLFKKPQREHSKLVVNKMYDLQGVCDDELTSLDLLSFCRQIVMGMEFLASNRVVHRDLAARNILVTGDRTLKISDFGLSRDVYQENQYKQKGNGKMPVKWMALESLSHRIYTTHSDVWSFGVVVWEVVTVGGAPYPDVPAARLPRLLRAGYRMPRPNNCSKHLYEVMLSCWRARPRDRPTFAELHTKLDELLNSACADEYLSLEMVGEDAPPTPKAQRYVKMILRGNRVWARGESYERPLKAPQSNHYTSPPAPLNRPQAV